MVQEEIVEHIRPQDILGLLLDFSILPGDQFRADGGLQNILEHPGQGGVTCVSGSLCHHQADGGFVKPGVDPIHAHVVAPKGGKAQGQFAHIPGANHEAGNLVGDVHEHLGALPGLGVFKHRVMLAFRVSDVSEMPRDTVGDVNLPRGETAGQKQRLGIAPGFHAGAKGRQGNRV